MACGIENKSPSEHNMGLPSADPVQQPRFIRDEICPSIPSTIDLLWDYLTLQFGLVFLFDSSDQMFNTLRMTPFPRAENEKSQSCIIYIGFLQHTLQP